jgi:hypothetical protein
VGWFGLQWHKEVVLHSRNLQ